MEGSARAVGVGGFVTWNGVPSLVRGRTPEYYAILEAEILAHRGTPFDMLVKAVKSSGGGLNDEEAGMLARVAADAFRSWRSATWSDYEAFLKTPRGAAIEIWYCLPDSVGSDTINDTFKKIMELATKQPQMLNEWYPKFQAAVDLASGTDELGNLIGLPSNQAATTGQSPASNSSEGSSTAESGTKTPAE